MDIDLDPNRQELIDTLKIAKNTNEYDYNKMLEDFELELRNFKTYQTTKKKWQNQYKQYLETVEHMKEKKKENFDNKRDNLIKLFNKKQKQIETQLYKIRESKEGERKKLLNKMKEKEELALERKKLKQQKEERDRLRYETQIYTKLDNLIDRHNSYEQKRRFDGLSRIERSENRHKKNMINEQKKLEEKEAQNKEKIFRTYMNFFFSRKNREKELKLKYKKNDNMLQTKAEKIEEMERDEEKKTNELIKKLKNIEKRKKEILKHKNDQIVSFNKKRKQFIDAAKEKKLNIIKDISENRFDVLDYQNIVLKRTENNDTLNNLKKSVVIEKTINDQMNFEKNLKIFYKKLEILKSENINRLSIEDRRKIFLRLKKKEAEKKKKEEEDKLLNMM